MVHAASRADAWRVILGLISVGTWAVLALYWSDLTLPMFCSAGETVPLQAALDLALVFNSPVRLASGWALMLVAMMPLLIIAPLRHVRERSFAWRRSRAMFFFVAGYAAVWMIAGLGLQAI